MRIYLVGAHSTGKTTLAEQLSNILRVSLIPEAARLILLDWNMSLSQVRLSALLSDKFQCSIFKKQLELEDIEESFIADRACDHLVYAAKHSSVANEICNSDDFRRYVQNLRDSYVFLVRPHKELLKEDGVRLDVNWDAVQRFDACVEFMLTIFGVPFVSIEDMGMADRIRTIRAVIRK